jgi:hypothetical protein
MVATNGRTVVKCGLAEPSDLGKGVSVFFPKLALSQLKQARLGVVELDMETRIATAIHKDKGHAIEVVFSVVAESYPVIESVIPRANEPHTEHVQALGIDPKLLASFKEPIRLTLYSKNGPIKVEPLSTTARWVGAVMPMRIDEAKTEATDGGSNG